MGSTTLTITRNKGMHLNFANGITISIQIGGGNYSDNYYEPIGEYREDLPPSRTAEVAMWDRDKNWADDRGGSDVCGYVKIDRVFEMIEILRALPDGATADMIRSSMPEVTQ